MEAPSHSKFHGLYTFKMEINLDVNHKYLNSIAVICVQMSSVYFPLLTGNCIEKINLCLIVNVHTPQLFALDSFK